MKALAVNEDIHVDDRTSNLKLVKDRTFNSRAWLIPLLVVLAVIVAIFILYNRLRQLLMTDFTTRKCALVIMRSIAVVSVSVLSVI